MSKITAEHLQRNACVYVRQSTPDQLVHNLESQRRQYGLADRAKQLGWTRVEIIDDDLGRSGGGIARPGFERLLAAICDGRVGAVLAIEASRLARNGRDWHTLIEFCAGELLLSGLLRCGHCGRKLHVHYSGKLGRYNCSGARMNHGAARCISVSGLSIDAAIGSEVLRIMRPLGIEAAIKAIEAQSGETTAAERQLELSLQQARYQAAHTRRQYDAVDPANRLVAASGHKQASLRTSFATPHRGSMD